MREEEGKESLWVERRNEKRDGGGGGRGREREF